MRNFSRLILLVSMLMFASAAHDEYRGITRIYAPRELVEVIIRKSSPGEFHNAMTYHWAFACVVLIVGIIVYSVANGLEKSDPLSPDYAGNQALDEWGDAMKKQEEQRNQPRP